MTPHIVIRPALQHCLQPFGSVFQRIVLGMLRYDKEEISLELVSILLFEPVIPM